MSSRSGLPRRKFSDRAVSVKAKPSDFAAAAAAATRSIACAEIVERPVLLAGRVLDRAAHQAGFGGEPHRLGGESRRVAETVLEIGRDRQVDGGGDGARMRQRLLAPHLAVAPAQRAGKSAAGRGQRLETEPGQDARRTRIPGLGITNAPGP